MARHCIPFINAATDWPFVSSTYPEAAGFRTTLQLLLGKSKPLQGAKLWIDSSVDGLHHQRTTEATDSTNTSFKEYISKFQHFNRIADPGFQRRPDKAVTGAFVRAVLSKALGVVPDVKWLSVPQLPYTETPDRNRINRALAEATRDWAHAVGYKGKLIVPVILSKTGSADRKTTRNPKIALATACVEASGAHGVWIVDSTLDDQDGVSNFENERFPGLIKFHEEMNAGVPSGNVAVGGPYWGLNLVLWVRGLIQFPAIGIGRSYRYYVAGGRQVEGKPRIALPPLRRLAVCSPALKDWLAEVLRKISRNDPAYGDFAVLAKNFDVLQNRENARRQVAKFYKEWLDKIESSAPTSRALGLYQDLSSAYVLGMGLPPLPDTEKVRNPARVAKQLMGNCL